jgi:hypothetical protein
VLCSLGLDTLVLSPSWFQQCELKSLLNHIVVTVILYTIIATVTLDTTVAFDTMVAFVISLVALIAHDVG